MRRRALAGLIAVGSTASFALFRIGQLVGDRQVTALDQRARDALLAYRTPRLDTLSAVLTALSAPPFLVPATLALAVANRKRGVACWLPLALSPFAAMTAGQLLTTWGPQQFPPDSEEGDCEPCFPSGHTTGLTAEALTVAYVLRREGELSRGGSVLMMLLPLAAGMNRLYRDRHWASDIAGGLAAGTAVGSLCAMVYEVLQTI